jgi:hypothetical protein
MLKTYWTPKQMAAALESESRTLSTARYAQMSPEKRAQLDARAASVYAQYQAMHDFAYNSPWSHRDHGNSGSQPLTIESLYKLVNPQPTPETNAEARQLDAESITITQEQIDEAACERVAFTEWGMEVSYKVAGVWKLDHLLTPRPDERITYKVYPDERPTEIIAWAAQTSTRPAPILVDTPAGAQYALPGLTPPAAQLRFC